MMSGSFSGSTRTFTSGHAPGAAQPGTPVASPSCAAGSAPFGTRIYEGPGPLLRDENGNPVIWRAEPVVVAYPHHQNGNGKGHGTPPSPWTLSFRPGSATSGPDFGVIVRTRYSGNIGSLVSSQAGTFNSPGWASPYD